MPPPDAQEAAGGTHSVPVAKLLHVLYVLRSEDTP